MPRKMRKPVFEAQLAPNECKTQAGEYSAMWAAAAFENEMKSWTQQQYNAAVRTTVELGTLLFKHGRKI